uniref:Uncharacterized protein n=1 Tax=Panagrellus redivivus TaxID=6233 RepID=A0A7E4V3Z8_PANRE
MVFHQTYGIDVVKEVEGGVEFTNTGSVELIVPEILSFTVKKSQLCVGGFVICYEATSTVMHDEQRAYCNLGTTCPLGTCTLMIHPNAAYYLSAKRSSDVAYLEFHDEFFRVCPRKVINNRANFTIVELPDCPVNNATLPKTTAKKNTTLATVGITADCVVAVIILVSIMIIGFCFYKRSKRQPTPSAKSVSPDKQISQSPAIPRR